MNLTDLTNRLVRAPRKGWLVAGLALAVLGARLAVFHWAGSPLPYFDQWMAEFDNGFMKASRGYSLWQTLSSSHNEHLLLTTKLFSFLGFALNGYWDVPFLAVLSAAVRAVEAGGVFALLTRGQSRGPVLAIWTACLVVFAAPISGFNLLCGLQVSFFFADLALIVALAVAVRWHGSGREAACLVGAQLFGLASLGSALVIPACTGAAALLLRLRDRRFWLAWTCTALLCAAYVLKFHEFGAGDVRRFEPLFFLRLLAWPFGSAALGAGIALVVLIALCRHGSARTTVTPAQAVSVGLIGFAMLNAALIALNRRPEEFHHRHWDTLGLLPLGLVALGAQFSDSTRFRRLIAGATVAFAAGAVLFLGRHIVRETWPYASAAHLHREENVTRYRALLLSGKIQHETERINRALTEGDYAFFDGPFDRYAMPPVAAHNYLRQPLPALAVLSPDIIPARAASFVSRLTRLVIRLGAWLLLPAVACAALGLRPERAGASRD